MIRVYGISCIVRGIVSSSFERNIILTYAYTYEYHPRPAPKHPTS